MTGYTPLANTQVRTTHMIVQNDRYDKNATTSEWVAGPNEVFYRSMALEGDVYREFVRPGYYSAVQQLEVDVCPIRDGWLSALVAEVEALLRTTAVISGSRVHTGIVCSSNAASYGKCTAASDLPDYIRRHVNGNAIYRLSDSLQDLLGTALNMYPEWPFDLAAYLTSNATNRLNLLRYSEFAHNRVVPVYCKHAYNPTLYDDSTYFVHCPKAYKTLRVLDVVDALILKKLPAVVIGACRSMHPGTLLNLQLSLQRRGVMNVVWTSGLDEPEILNVIMRMRPLAYAESSDLRRAPTSAQCVPPLDIIEHLRSRGHSVFYMDADAVMIGKIAEDLAALDQHAIHFASGSVQSHGHNFMGEGAPRYRFTSKAFYVPGNISGWRGLAYIWRKTMVQHGSPDLAINSGANCTEISACQWNAVPIRLLAPEKFVSGNNLLKLWPSRNVAKQATVYIDVARGLDGPQNVSQETNGEFARFRLQQMKQWLLPQEQSCCSTVMVADDVVVNEDAEAMHAFVNLLLHMHEAAPRNSRACVVPPFLDDARTGLMFPYDVIFDPIYLLSHAKLYPSLTDAPICHGTTVVHNASADRIPSGIQHWPVQAFSQELRGALGQVSRSSLLLADSICLADRDRTSVEAALHLLRGSSTQILSAANDGRYAYVSGKWRILDKHLRKALPNVHTLLSPELYLPRLQPLSFYSSFGLRSHYPRLGEDPTFDVLDALVCRCAWNETIATAPAMGSSQCYAKLLEYIEPDVLAEDLEIATKMYYEEFDATKFDLGSRANSTPAPPFLIPIDTLENNGFSNLVNDVQVLAYIASKVGLRATMVPLCMKHLVNLQRPWSDVVINVQRLYTKMKVLRPSTWALLRHPSLLIEALDGYMLPVDTTKKWNKEAPALGAVDPWLKLAEKLHSKYVFRRMLVASNVAEWESKLLLGYDIVMGESTAAYLGLDDDQIVSTFGSALETGQDVVFRSFRAFNFQNGNSEHAAFAAAWREVFKIPLTYRRRVQGIIRRLAPSYTCYHARVADEFALQHKLERPHFQKTNVFSMLRAFIADAEGVREATSSPNIYITSDINERVDIIAGRTTGAATSCHAFGCGQVKDDVPWGLIEREVCAAAHKFIGNIYSTFTLSICAHRDDQSCHDMFGQSLSDGRLLF